MIRLAIAAVILSAAFLTVTAGRALLVTAEHHVQTGNSRITEDDPRWDCQTMGNHVCGGRP